MPQSNGRPSGGAGKLRPTLDSERSPSVHYANWKETMLLERQLSTLSRTEKSLVHGITVDQKVAFRRFQSKLQRSKITNARMWSDKEAEIELRDAGMRRLHSESHLLDDGKSDFLSKLEKRPYTAEISEEKDYKDEEKLGKPVLNTSPGQNTRSFTVPIIFKQHVEEKVTNKDALNDLVSPNALTNKSFTENKLILKPISNLTSEASSKHTQPFPADEISATVSTEVKPTEIIKEKEQQVKIDPLVTSERQNEEDERNMPSKENVASTTSNRELIKNPRNVLRPGQSTFPTQKPPELSVDNETISSSNDIICKGESNKENEAKMESSGQEIPEAPVRPRNPRNRIRPGQSSFLATNKPVASTEKPPMLSDTTGPSEISPTARNDSQAAKNPGGSFMKEFLTTEQPQRSPTKTKSKGEPDSKISGNEQGSNAANRMHQKRRSIQLRGSVPGRPSLFTEMERPNYCQMRLDAVKSISFATRVQSFCEGIEELGESATHCDYYATKMHDMVAGQKKHFLTEDTTTIQPCEEDLRRHMGNTAMPCITLKKVRLDAAADYDTAPYSSFNEDLEFASSKPAYQYTAVEGTADSE